MKRVVKYIAKDGTEFESSDACFNYDRSSKFAAALAVFMNNKLPDITEEEVKVSSRFLEAIYADPDAFLAVLESAQEPKRRGRPKKSRASAPKAIEVTNNEVEEKPVEVIQSTTPVVKKPITLSGAWRSFPTPKVLT